MTPKQPAFTGKWLVPEQLGYVLMPDLCTYKVTVYRSPTGELREWDADKGRPMIFVDDNIGPR